MIYYEDAELCIRSLTHADAEKIVTGEIAQGWTDATIDKYEMRLRDEADGRAVTLVAVYHGEPCGYVHVYRKATGPFADTGYPEIVDFGVLEKYRRRGIGSRLMDAAERIAGQLADTVAIGVGLHSGYGSAQRMYVKRGYLPDGSGVWYRDKVCPPYSTCENGDALVLHMSKRLR